LSVTWADSDRPAAAKAWLSPDATDVSDWPAVVVYGIDELPLFTVSCSALDTAPVLSTAPVAVACDADWDSTTS
jgi:hypothetical protein